MTDFEFPTDIVVTMEAGCQPGHPMTPGFCLSIRRNQDLLAVAQRASSARYRLVSPQADVDADEVDRLKRIIATDRTGMAEALNAVIRECASRMWVTEGRGPYEWDDDRYKDEAGQALRAVARIAKQALVESGDRVTAAFHPAMRKKCTDA